jgi:hypothetical protein
MHCSIASCHSTGMTSLQARAEAIRGATTMSALTRYEQLSREIE